MASRSKTGRELRDAARLAVVPLAAAALFGVLMAPRAAAPEDVPVPIVDERALAATIAEDRALAARVEAEPLDARVRSLGSAMREFHALEVDGSATGQQINDARRRVDSALGDAMSAGGATAVARLRAVQLEQFVGEVHRFERTGQESEELHALAGGFVRSIAQEGWVEGGRLAPDDRVVRVMFKHMFSSFLTLEGQKELAPTLDEERALYAFYLSHPHPARGARDAIEAARRGARDDKACTALAEAKRAATESWRLERIARLAAIDPQYPAAYARGVAQYRRGDWGAAAQSFRTWLQDHPDGPMSLRAQNFLRAAVVAERPEP